MRLETPNRKKRNESSDVIASDQPPVKIDGRKLRWMKHRAMINAQKEAERSPSPIFRVKRHSKEERNKLIESSRNISNSDQFTDSMSEYSDSIVIIDPNVCPDHQP